MAVLCEAFSVLVPVEVLLRVYPGGPSAYENDCPNSTFVSDGILTRVGFMNPHDVGHWIGLLEDKGAVFTRTNESGEEAAVDIVVVDQIDGPTAPCDWILLR